MKKFIAFFLIICLFSSPLSLCSVLADSMTPYTTREEAIAYIRSQLAATNTHIALKITQDLASDFYTQDIIQEYCEHTGKGNEGDYLRNKIKQITTKISNGYYPEVVLDVIYNISESQEVELTNRLSEIYKEISPNGKSEAQVIKTVYNYIIENSSYDYATLDDEGYELKFTAYSALILKTAVCSGLTALFYRMLNDLGIDCRVVSGYATTGTDYGAHSWNIVKIGDLYYNIDLTFDKTYGESLWYLCGDEFFTDHYCDQKFLTDEFKERFPLSPDPYANTSETSCGHVPADPVIENEVTATCAQERTYENVVYCSVCGTEISRIKINTGEYGDHIATEWKVMTEPTCINSGKMYTICTLCGVKFYDSISAKGHKKGDFEVVEENPATCTESGSRKLECRCTICDEVLQIKEELIEPTGHQVTDGICTVCGQLISGGDAGNVTTEVITGDVNGDGKIRANDARKALRFSADLESPTAEELAAADLNGDGSIRASEARKILRVSADLMDASELAG